MSTDGIHKVVVTIDDPGGTDAALAWAQATHYKLTRDVNALKERLVTLTGPGGPGKTRLAWKWHGPRMPRIPTACGSSTSFPSATPALSRRRWPAPSNSALRAPRPT